MKKINKVFTLDQEIVEQLQKTKNASALVNGLLKDHFKFADLDKLSVPELEKKIQIAERKQKLQEEMEKLEKELNDR